MRRAANPNTSYALPGLTEVNMRLHRVHVEIQPSPNVNVPSLHLPASGKPGEFRVLWQPPFKPGGLSVFDHDTDFGRTPGRRVARLLLPVPTEGNGPTINIMTSSGGNIIVGNGIPHPFSKIHTVARGGGQVAIRNTEVSAKPDEVGLYVYSDSGIALTNIHTTGLVSANSPVGVMARGEALGEWEFSAPTFAANGLHGTLRPPNPAVE